MRRVLGLFAATAIAWSLQATSPSAAPITAAQILSTFNVVVAEDLSTNSDIEGWSVVGRDLVGGATFNNGRRATGGSPAYGAVNVGRDVTAPGSYNVNNGGNVIVGGVNRGTFNLNGGGSLTTGTANFRIADLIAPLRTLSDQLAGLAANSQVNDTDLNNVIFRATPDANGRAVFSVSTAEMQTYRNMIFDLNSADTVIVNVTGTSFLDMANFNAGADVNQRVLWNFQSAERLDFQRFWHGTVLALDAHVTNSTPIEGVLLARSFAGSGELHDFPFLGTIQDSVAVPEPASAALLGVSLLGLVAAGRRTRRRPAHA